MFLSDIKIPLTVKLAVHTLSSFSDTDVSKPILPITVRNTPKTERSPMFFYAVSRKQSRTLLTGTSTVPTLRREKSR